jgi:hypothetical protein
VLSCVSASPSFEFCAFSFLRQWQENECALHSAISSAPSEDNVRKALGYFRVARTFKDLVANLTVILHSLNGVRRDQTLSTPHEKVDRLAECLSRTFNKVNISAASKLLWLSYRDPFVIYDNRAVNALKGRFDRRFSNYEEYSKVWREEYRRYDDKIQSAVEKLPKGRMFMRSCTLSDEELMRMVKEAWFTERVFDIFLWEIGGR